ncbi:hypothetical protein K461DRAFT_236178 [Myriangium duriaei CBS 260.36]|uniref:histidine kinase n=1 Tax=Myriangium duriaei CBS 260.36 TaxID=1168546 RepID=A0A9P4JF85_9PEZI|nr:hypothetical protein K461DRAFT_236178 [Myriangium duriaei CBS 260.36]
MECVTLKATLDADPRPSFVLDLEDVGEGSTHLKPCHFSRSAKKDTSLFDVVTSRDNESVRFRRWANASKSFPSLGQAYRTHRGPYDTLWISYDIADRWRVIQNSTIVGPAIPFDVITPPEDANPKEHQINGLPGSLGQLSIASSPRRSDVTSIQKTFGLSPEAVKSVQGLEKHLEIIAAFDWSATSLGSIENLPGDLLQLIHLILLDPAPQCLFLGDNHILLYNVAYAVFAGERHPSIMGRPIFEAWKEAIELNVSIFTFIDSTGCPFIMDDFNISLNRNGYLEEMYLKWTTIPLKGPVRGYLCTASEETARKITERRKALLSRVSEACRGIRDMSPFWKAVLETLGTNGKDFPFAFIYSKDMNQEHIYHLEGVLDAEDPLSILPATIDSDKSQECFVPVLREALTASKPVPIKHANGTLPECIIKLSEMRGSQDRCLEGIACPIKRASDQMTLGVLVIGVNTRKTFDPVDRAFVGYMIRALGDLATNTINAQESDRFAKQAASQQQTLIQALASTTLEADHMSAKLQRIVKMLEMVDVGLFEFNMDGTLLQANEAFFKLTGHPRGNAAPHAWKDTVHDDDLQQAEAQFRRASQGEHVNFEMRYKVNSLDGLDRDDAHMGKWASVFVVPILDKTGVVTCVSGCVADITDQKRRQQDAINRAETLEKLRASEKRFHKFAQHALCPIFMYDTNRQLQFCNDAYCKMIGGESGKEMAEMDGANVIHPDDLEDFYKFWDKSMREQKPLQYTCRLKEPWTGPDGASGETWVVASAYPEVDKEGNITGWIGLLIDISQLKWAERVQELRMQEAVEAKRQQENFIDMTSHEIRNPLGAVVHCADSILTSLVDLEALTKEMSAMMPHKQMRQLLDIYESSFDAVNTIISCSTHQRRIVDDVLTWSKLNSNLLKITPSMVRSAAILQDIRNMFELDAQKVGVALNVVQDAGGADNVNAEWVMLDPGRLMQILINLITNAIKFTREKSFGQVTVTMGVTSSKPSLDRLPIDFVPSSDRLGTDMNNPEWGTGDMLYLYFIVEDTGCGLSPEEKSRIFSRFAQGSPRTHTKYGGSGLGLFISRELVQLQCGEIGFASQAGIGSKFGFFIKARKANIEKAGSETPNMQLRRLNSFVPSVDQRYSILVVEDNQVNQAVLSKQLRKLGHEVHVASDGAEALKFIQTTRYWRADTPVHANFASAGSKGSSGQVELSVILMDVEMPVMDGLTCAAEIRRFQREGCIEGHLPIIAVSANARAEQVNQAISCGMDDAISKPFRIVDLMPKIERLVG